MEHYCLEKQIVGCGNCRYYSMDNGCNQEIMNKDDELDNYS